jgi:tRNA(Ile)-lysidine synthase
MQEVERKFLQNMSNLPDASFLVACSGGPDSMCVLHLMNKHFGQHIRVVHICHNQRPEEQEIDKNIVQIFCSENTIPLDIVSLDEMPIDASEETLRIARFSAVCKLMQKNEYLVTGHTRDDLVESFIFRLARGTGVTGSRGMRVRDESIVRPLLTSDKQAILEYNTAHHVPFALDSSNYSLEYDRNIVRHYVLPYLSTINTSAKEHIVDFLDLLTSYEQEIDTTYQDMIDSKSLNRDALKDINPVIIVHIVSKWLARNGVFWTNATRDKWLNLIDWILKSASGKQFVLDETRALIHEYDMISITERTQKVFMKQTLSEGITAFDEHTIELTPVTEAQKNTSHSIYVTIPHDAMPLYVRTRKEGDIFKPLNGKGSVKLKEFFINAKVPKSKRDRIPIIVDRNDQIIWVCGMRCATMPSRKNALLINLRYHEQKN